MPLYYPPAAGGGVGGEPPTSVDEAGFIVVTGGPLPFKDVATDMEDGTMEFKHVVKHPTLGEVDVAVTVVPIP